MRIDKWLWAARFYKTRGLASDAVDGGKVKLNGVGIKPAKEVKPGDTIHLHVGNTAWEVVVRGLNAQRRPAPEARLLYEETADSATQRAKAAELRALAPSPDADRRGRPTKRERRQIGRLRGD